MAESAIPEEGTRPENPPAPARPRVGFLSPRIRLRGLAAAIAAAAAIFAATFFYATIVEVRLVAVRRLPSAVPVRFVFLADIHHRDDAAHLRRVVAAVNRERPAFVCLGGDIVEDPAFLTEALDILAGISAPVYAVPGNHEYWGRVPLERIDAALRARGGRLLVNASVRIAPGVALVGLDDALWRVPNLQTALAGTKGDRLVFLFHEPGLARALEKTPFILGLAGHSHGGQVRLPFKGAVVLPLACGGLQYGRYETPGGPVYVTSGIGTWAARVRFLCRPEIVVFDPAA